MQQTIQLTSAIDQFNFNALYRAPEGDVQGSVIILQEIYGLDPYIQRDADRWANLGYHALAPSMFDRVERGYVGEHDAAGTQLGVQHLNSVGNDNPIADIQACIDWLADRGPVYIVGYCYGGTQAWRAAALTQGLTAAVCYYGGGIRSAIHCQPACPVICHFGEQDPYVDAATNQRLLAQHHPNVAVFIYPESGHGFNNEGPTSAPADVALARQRTVEFFQQFA
ncbi:dienelactone hydrolase family protein [Teredinibacter turnerae]|uniref:dienelactone hydrolase family protein n=1 Tax=Teredinibacter turnerae TaxID=2426 RepID=UPI0030CFBDA5